MNGHIRVVLGSGIIIFLVASIFWAGSTYQRVGSIEGHLGSIDVQLVRLTEVLTDVRSVQDKTQDNQRRIEKLEDQIRQLK